MHSRTTRTHILSLITLIIALGIAIMVFVILPAVTQIWELERYIADAHAAVETEYVHTRNLHRSIKEFTRVLAERNKFNAAALEPASELTLITSLEKIAEKNHITQTLHVDQIPNPVQTLKDIIPGIQNGPRLPVDAFTFTNRGAWQDHVAYLNDLEHLPVYIIINNLNWTKDNNTSDAPTNTSTVLNFIGYIYINQQTSSTSP